MKPKFKDVAHFYQGTQCRTPQGIDILKAVYQDDDEPVFYNLVSQWRFDQIKPILKPLSGITEDDFREFAELIFETKNVGVDCSVHNWAAWINDNHVRHPFFIDATTKGCLDTDLSIQSRWIAFLCSKSYNVFGLPESEIAKI